MGLNLNADANESREHEKAAVRETRRDNLKEAAFIAVAGALLWFSFIFFFFVTGGPTPSRSTAILVLLILVLPFGVGYLVVVRLRNLSSTDTIEIGYDKSDDDKITTLFP